MFLNKSIEIKKNTEEKGSERGGHLIFKKQRKYLSIMLNHVL